MGKLTVSSFTETFIDFTETYYDDGGIVILMPRNKKVQSLFLFIEVFSIDVWLCILATVITTGVLLYAFDRFRIYLYKAEMSELQFNFIDSLWTSIGNFFSAGGLNPPKSKAIIILLASFWVFSTICLTTYQANLSAFLTSSRLKTQISSIKQLVSQTDLDYSVICKFTLLVIEFYPKVYYLLETNSSIV
jgi:hypothetical protein